MESTQIFTTFIRKLLEALNQRLLDNAAHIARRTGTYNPPKRYLVTDARPEFFEIRRSYRSVIRLENNGFVSGDDSVLIVQVVGTGQVHSTIFVGRNNTEEDMKDAVNTVIRLDKPP